MPTYSEKVIHNAWQSPVSVLYLTKMKTKWTSYNEQQRNLTLQADINRMNKQGRYMEWIIAACVGASIALTFVIAHQMIVTEWTW